MMINDAGLFFFFFYSPFNIDVAHLLPADADVIQDDITGVPDDAAQEESDQKHSLLSMDQYE